MKKKLYTAPESIVVEFEASSIMTGSKTLNPPISNIDDDGEPESASRRGNDWNDYFGY